MHVSRTKLALLVPTLLGGLALAWLGTLAAQPGKPPARDLGKKDAPPEPLQQMPKEVREAIKDASPSLLTAASDTSLIDLPSALSLAGVRNPQMLLARERVLEATALRQLAAAQFLPSLNFGTSFDNHNGNMLTSEGQIRNLNRTSYYVGAGSMAIGAGTVSIPGIYLNINVSDTFFKALEARQTVRRAQASQRAVDNATLLRVAIGYLELVRAEGRRAVGVQNLADANDVAVVTDAFAKVGEGREADADRALAERFTLEAALRQEEGIVVIASARLAALLDLPPIPRLHPAEDRAVPAPEVPDPIPLSELLAIALVNRPELQAQQAAIRQMFLSLTNAKVLPFSPNVIVGLSYGAEGGGGDLAAAPAGSAPTAFGSPRLSNLYERGDLDAAMYWSLQNLGVGNLAMIRAARSNLASANLQMVQVMNDVQAEVAIAYGRVHARLARIETCEKAVKSIQIGYGEDKKMIRGGQGLPIELLNSLRLLARSRLAYLDAIVDYNEAQMELYVALGQPPADVLARPVPPPPPEPARQRTR